MLTSISSNPKWASTSIGWRFLLVLGVEVAHDGAGFDGNFGSQGYMGSEEEA